MKNNAKLALFLGLVSIVILLGCADQKVWVTIKPQFDYQKIRTIAVLPFLNEPGYPEAGEIVSDKLTDLLVQRSKYNVLPESKLQAAIPKQDMYLSAKQDPSRAMEICRLVGADAILTGTVKQYKADHFHEVRHYIGDPYMPEDEPFHAYYYDELPHDWFKIDAIVEVSINLIDCSTGKTIWSDSKMGTFQSFGSPPPLSEVDVLSNAADSSVRKLFLGLVVHQEWERVPRRSILTCSEYIDHPIDKRKTFSASDPHLYVVVQLNRDFAGKQLLLKIDKGDTGGLIAQYQYRWEPATDTHAFKVDTKDLIDKGGYGKYRATYFLDDKKIAHTEFKIDQQ